jgi:putative oxidoreductase
MTSTTTVSREARHQGIQFRLAEIVRAGIKWLDYFRPVADLLVRLWVANVFWKSGLTKIQSMGTTIQLFKYEYEVPLLPPEIAAYLATFSEIVFAALLAIGLAGRFSAAALFAVNIVAVISYPALQAPGLEQHQVWGLLLLVSIAYGPGKLSLDHLIARRFGA